MIHIFKIQQSFIVRAFVTGYGSKRTVAQAAADFHATIQPGNHSIVVNGDGFPASGFQSNSIWVSDGKWRNTVQMEWRPRVTFDRNHKMAIGFRETPFYYPEKVTDWNAFSLTRRLVMGGKVNPAFRDNGELNSRLGFGVTAGGELVMAGTDGWDVHHEGLPAQGWTLTRLAEELIAQGVVEGGDGDSGGSYTLAIDGTVVNEWYNDGEPMRAVVNHLCLEVTEILGVVVPPPEPPDPEPEPEPENPIVQVNVIHADGSVEEFVPK